MTTEPVATGWGAHDPTRPPATAQAPDSLHMGFLPITRLTFLVRPPVT